MITNFELHDFKGHRDTRLTLGRFTALVGDNASGKTSVLEAIELLGTLDPDPISNLRGVRNPSDLVRRGGKSVRLGADGWLRGEATRTEFEIQVPAASGRDFSAKLTASRGDKQWSAATNEYLDPEGGDLNDSSGTWDVLRLFFGTAMLYRLSAPAISGYSPVEDPGVQVDQRGANTGTVLTALKLTDDVTFERIEASLRRLVPTVERVRLKQERRRNQVVNRLRFDFRGAANIPAHGASQGTLVLLALLTVLHSPGRPNLVLLDDFDHTLHPRAQMELVRLIQSFLSLDEFADVQVVATTHSPYVLDEMDVADVHAFAIDGDGCVRSKPLSAHPEAERSKGTLTAGQLWSLDPERAWVLKE